MMLHILGKNLLIFPNYIPAGISNLMDHTDLGLGLREYIPDSVGKTIKIISDSTEYILYVTSFYISEDAHSKSCRFVLFYSAKLQYHS